MSLLARSVSPLFGLIWVLLIKLVLSQDTDIQYETLRPESYAIFDSDYAKLPNGSSIAQANYVAAVAKFESSFLNDYTIHQYNEPDALARSAGPQVDQEKCLDHLRELNQRLGQLLQDKLKSRDINLYRLLDTYGRIAPGRLLGDTFWPGHYSECLNLGINSPKFGHSKTKFCWALTHDLDWPSATEEQTKVGVCLPDSCDALDYGNKFELIESLIDFNNRDVDRNTTRLVSLYCLPDEKSPMRKGWWYSSLPTVIFISASLYWLYYVFSCTIKLEQLKKKYGLERAKNRADFKVWERLSVIENFKKFADLSSHKKAAGGGYVVDLDSVDASKAFGLQTFMTSTHSMLFAHTLWDNHKDVAHTWSPLFVLLHLQSGFMTSAFMGITGLLTSYSLFKRQQQKPFMHNPFKWLDLFVVRYIRLIIVYAFMIGFAKYVGKFLGAGPFWDYGTSYSPRHHYNGRALCSHESWWDTLLMVKNFEKPPHTCLPVGWYLANDFQFLLVAPIFLGLMQYNEKLGRRFTLVCIALFCLHSNYAAYKLIDGVDARPLAGYALTGLRISFDHLMPIYTYPWHRINAYLLGLLLGNLLFRYEQQRRQHKTAPAKSDTKTRQPVRHLAYNLDVWVAKVTTVAVLVHLATPFVARLLPPTETEARILASLVMPLSFLISTLVFVSITVLCATDQAPRWLSKLLRFPLWRPIGRLTSCVTLTQFEPIIIFSQAAEHTFRADNNYFLSLYIGSHAAVLVVALVAHLLIEEPGRRLAELFWSKALWSIEEFWHLPKIGQQIQFTR